MIQGKPQLPITLTGIDETCDLSDFYRVPTEVGFLWTENPEGRKRYPRLEWSQKAARKMNCTALHVCGKEAKEKLLHDDVDITQFGRIQINGYVGAVEIETLCDRYPRKTFIGQIGPHKNNHLLMVEWRPNFSLLVDESDGKGISPKGWWCPKTIFPVGFAGGLGPNNLMTQLFLLKSKLKHGWWVDIESNLRDGADRFCTKRASACAVLMKLFMELTKQSR